MAKSRKGQLATTNLAFGMTILIVGVVFVVVWSLGEAFGNTPLSTLAKWGLGLFPIIMEIIKTIMRGFK